MMHGREKSDSVIVAVKSPNKTGEPAAEAMERRAGAEENASQQRTHRTQSRERVSQTPERVRTAGRKVLPSLSEVGAGCGKAARPVLGGGTRVTRFPTAIATPPSGRASAKDGRPPDRADRRRRHEWRLRVHERPMFQMQQESSLRERGRPARPLSAR